VGGSRGAPSRAIGRSPYSASYSEHAEAELVAARVGRCARRPLLGRHVRGRTDHRAGLGQRAGEQIRRRLRARLGVGIVLAACEPEVGDARAALAVDEHVVELEVAVDDAGGVRGDEPASRAAKQLEHLAPAALLSLEPAPQRLAWHELHREKYATGVRADVVDRDDVRVRQPRHRLRLAQQARLRVDAAAGPHQLDRDVAHELRVGRREHDAHATFADLIRDDVAAYALAARDRLERRARAAALAPSLLGLLVLRHRFPSYTLTMATGSTCSNRRREVAP
jgi:hypothetical protein